MPMPMFFYKAWKKGDIKTVTESVLRNNNLWETDLTQLPGFKDAVTKSLEAIMDIGALQLLEKFDLKSLVK